MVAVGMGEQDLANIIRGDIYELQICLDILWARSRVHQYNPLGCVDQAAVRAPLGMYKSGDTAGDFVLFHKIWMGFHNNRTVLSSASIVHQILSLPCYL